MSVTHSKKMGFPKLKWIIIICVLIVVLIWLSSWYLIDEMIINEDKRGAFGDKFGAINSLFSGLAFAGLIVTLLMQREELKAQREELILQRQEMKRSREVFNSQNILLKQQQFENSFFNMLKTLQDIIKALPNDSGISRFESMYNCCYNILNDLPLAQRKRTHVHDMQIFEEKIDMCLPISKHEICADILANTRLARHYYSHIHQIIIFVDKTELIAVDKRAEYVHILRAQLSYYELFSLFFYGLNSTIMPNINPPIKTCIERYSLLAHFDHNMLIGVHKNLISSYKDSAYRI